MRPRCADARWRRGDLLLALTILELELVADLVLDGDAGRFDHRVDRGKLAGVGLQVAQRGEHLGRSEHAALFAACDQLRDRDFHGRVFDGGALRRIRGWVTRRRVTTSPQSRP